MYAAELFVGFCRHVTNESYALGLVLRTNDEPGSDHAGGAALKRKSRRELMTESTSRLSSLPRHRFVKELRGNEMLMRPPGSASTASPPTVRNQSRGAGTKPAASTPDTSPAKAWADALAQAKVNSPQQTVTVKPGDSLASIAESHGDTLSSVEGANPQVQPPWLLPYPDTVRLPKKTPAEVVSGVNNADVKPIITAMAHANAADQNLQETEVNAAKLHVRDPSLFSDAETQSTNSWNTVEQNTINMLMNNSGGAYPERAAAAEVKQLNALEPGNAKFAAANNAALAEATKQWTQMGVTYPQLHPIISAYDNVKQISNNIRQVRRDLQNPHLPHNMAIVDGLNSEEQQNIAELNAAKAKLNTDIENSLNQAANQAGTNPAARSQAMTQRASYLQLVMPQDKAFQAAVGDANYDLQVVKPAKAVAAAYAKGGGAGSPELGYGGGALAAANTLNAVTHAAGNPYYASQIIQLSEGTIEGITKYMGSIASEPVHNPGTVLEFNQIYGDLSQSVAAANTVNPNGKLSSYGKDAADLVANSIVKNIPQNLTLDQGSIYNEAAMTTIGDGDGTALTLATAAALDQRGRSELAAFLTVGAARGLEGLASNTTSHYQAFLSTLSTVDKLRATWTSFMTRSQLADATNGYLKDHNDVQQKADAQLTTLSQDGDAIAEAKQAWNSYRSQLAGVIGENALSAAAQSLTNKNVTGKNVTIENVAVAFAISRSTSVNNAIVNAGVGFSAPSTSSGGAGQSVAQALLASPVWSLPRSWRSAINNTLKYVTKKYPNVSVSPGTFTTLGAVGLVLTTANLVGNFSFSSFQKAASTIYAGLGIPKYLGDVISTFAKTNIGDSILVQNFVNSIPGVTLTPGATAAANELKLSKTLPSFFQPENGDLTKLTKTPFFKALGSTYYGFGALASVFEAADDVNSGDNAGAIFSSAEALGNALNAAKPLAEEAWGDVIAEGFGATGSIIGGVAVLSQLIYDGVKSAEATQAYKNDTAQFLRQGLGLNPKLADELSADPSTPGVLAQYAKKYGMERGQLLLDLNKVPAQYDVAQFINEAQEVPQQVNGNYVSSQLGDSPNPTVEEQYIVGPNGQTELVHVPLRADSLTQLHYWADLLFSGKNRLG
jgi:LysM repeat protein